MTKFTCPVCGDRLITDDRIMHCLNGHCYDLSKYKTVNLMRSQKSGKKRHGDDRLMLNARCSFLSKGFYEPLLKAVTDKVCTVAHGEPITVLDAGCGEGYYTSYIQEVLFNSDVYGIDISKDALISAAKRNKNLHLAVASCAEIPVADRSCDVVLNIFSPTISEEFARILNDGGYLIRVIPLEMHLFSLKKSIYDKPYKNKSESMVLDGFKLTDKTEIKYSLTLTDNDDIQNLFKMTPYYYKTSREDQAKLKTLRYLETEIEFGILSYIKEV